MKKTSTMRTGRSIHRIMRLLGVVIGICMGAAAYADDLVIRGVSVIPMTAGGDVMDNVTVTIRGDRIESIAASSAASVKKKARVVDGRGKWLMPGLADMHVHLENDRLGRLLLDPGIRDGTFRTEDILLPYVANGVLQIAVLSAMRETVAQRDEVEGGVLGPHIALAAMIDGVPPIWPEGMTRVAASPGEGRLAVRQAAQEGHDFIKTYSNLNLETFLAVVDEARKHDMRVVGHLPGRNQGLLEKLLVPGFDMVAHAEELALQTARPAVEKIPHYAELLKRNGTWLASTLSLDERILEQVEWPETLKTRPEIRYLPPQIQAMFIDHNPYVSRASPEFMASIKAVIEFNRRLVHAFAKRGVPIVAASDALNPGMVPGFSLHDELDALGRAGLDNRTVLESATRLPAEWLGTIGDRGEVVPGKRADLLLLDANPLEDLKNTRRIAAVIVSGRYYSRANLDARMEALRGRYSSEPGKKSSLVEPALPTD